MGEYTQVAQAGGVCRWQDGCDCHSRAVPVHMLPAATYQQNPHHRPPQGIQTFPSIQINPQDPGQMPLQTLSPLIENLNQADLEERH